MARQCTVALILLTVFVAGCAGQSRREEGSVATTKTIDQVLAAHTDSLMAVPGVVGTALGLCDGVKCIKVLLADSTAIRQRLIPEQIEGYPVLAEVTGTIRPR